MKYLSLGLGDLVALIYYDVTTTNGMDVRVCL